MSGSLWYPGSHSEFPGPGGFLALRLGTLLVLLVLMTLHLRSVRVFRWEQTVTGGVLVTFCMAELGLALCAGTQACHGTALQMYICIMGMVIFFVNASVIWRRWRTASDITRVVAELLESLGVPLERQVITKVTLSVVAAAAFLIDVVMSSALKHFM